VALVRLLRIHGDWALALALAAAFQAEVWTLEVSHGPTIVGISSGDRALAAAIGVVLPLSLASRRRAPLAVLALAVATSVAANFLWVLDAGFVLAVALMVAAYSAGAHTVAARARIAVVGVGALIAINAAINGFALGDTVFIAMILGGAWLAGRAMHYHREREQLLKTLMIDLERERDTKARSAVAEERIRIARELHDIVAHAISVIVLQARGARRSLTSHPSETREALDTIEATGGQALTEMRRLLGLLRTGEEEVALAPQPSLRFIEQLVAHVREAGVPVDVTVEGEPIELPPGIDLSAYRIVQESLTNTLKHAGSATARVVIRYRKDDLELEVADSGVRAAGGDGEGHGLVGMRERVLIYGGRLETGRRDSGGFTVRARLPLVPGQW